jgi:hypothetical protein
MSALEQEIIQKLHNLDEEKQKRVLAFISTIQPEPFDFISWLREVETLQTELAAKYGKNHTFGTLDLLDELREEASWPR